MAKSFLYTIEQERAQQAQRCAQDFCDKHVSDVKKRAEYESAAEKLPAMIVNCGLLQALVFHESKGHQVYNDLQKWFCQHYRWGKEVNLSKKLMYLDVSEYREKTREALAFLTWLKRFIVIVNKKLKTPQEDRKNEPTA